MPCASGSRAVPSVTERQLHRQSRAQSAGRPPEIEASSCERPPGRSRGRPFACLVLAIAAAAQQGDGPMLGVRAQSAASIAAGRSRLQPALPATPARRLARIPTGKQPRRRSLLGARRSAEARASISIWASPTGSGCSNARGAVACRRDVSTHSRRPLAGTIPITDRQATPGPAWAAPPPGHDPQREAGCRRGSSECAALAKGEGFNDGVNAPAPKVLEGASGNARPASTARSPS
ncbi:MAG: hypothetical protein KatS3mg060_2360 [Dehalococcoidia bacterium]|nr:MAG: hypothetical protein KatS3mg060_2360 [Dehalococcoidia bacterium]